VNSAGQVVNGFGSIPDETLYFPLGQDCRELEVSNPQETLFRMPLCRMKCDASGVQTGVKYVGRTMFYRCKAHTHAYGYTMHFGSWQWLEPMYIQLTSGLNLGDSYTYSISSYPFDMGDMGYRQPDLTMSGAAEGYFAGRVQCVADICDVEQIVNATDCHAGGGVAKFPGLDLMDCTERVPYGGNCTVTCAVGY
jgi:hypothetical protein